ncbi:MAG: GNAT family N-acetyltransferase [Anaerolineales bacterium]|nr:GNAT family N-acetyltransferase [Anaerolineales bacterium]
MPEIEIRPVKNTDVPSLLKLDHNYSSNKVWQMELNVNEAEVNLSFRQANLPRTVQVEYPRLPETLVEEWSKHAGILVALLGGEIIGYTRMVQDSFPFSILMTDLVVNQSQRRQGIGSALVLAALEWANTRTGIRRLILEIQPKNYPAICLAKKLGFEFCGFNDHYYRNQDTALFFDKWF